MSKHGPSHDAGRAFRGELHTSHSDFASAGERFHAAAYPQFARAGNEQPKASDNGSNGSSDRPGQIITPIDTKPPATAEKTQIGAAARPTEKPSGGDVQTQRPALDPRQSVAKHIESGAFKKSPATGDANAPEQAAVASRPDAGRETGDKTREVTERSEPVSKVKVVYQDQSIDPAQRANKPDFIVKKDGSVEVVNDPEKSNRKEIVVQVERNQGEVTGPNDAQRKSTDELVAYVSDRMMKPNQDGTKDGVIDDQQGLVSEGLKNRLKTQPAPEEHLPEPQRRQVENMQRFSGGGRGTMSADQADSYFTPRDQAPARRTDESKRDYSVKEAVAGMLSYGDAQPYEAVRNTGDRGLAVGRYQLTYDLVVQWLTDLMGDPPDEARLDALVKAGKMSPQMAARLKSPQFRQFLEKLKSSQQPSTAEIKDMMPKELQEQIGGDLVNKFSTQCRDAQGQVDVGKVALAMATGHVPTDADLAKPENKAFVSAGRRLGDISDARTDNPSQPLEWQEVNQRLLMAAKQSVGKAMWNSGRWNPQTLENGNLGCAASVSEVMKVAGVDGHAMSAAGVTLLEEKILKEGGYRVNNPQPGDIVVGQRGAGQHGHIGIVGEDGKVYHNSSAKRQWVEADLSTVFGRGRGFTDVHYVRLPANAANA